MKTLVLIKNVIFTLLLLPLLAYASLLALPIAIGMLIYRSATKKETTNARY